MIGTKHLYLAFALGAGVVAFSGCKKESDGAGQGAGSSSSATSDAPKAGKWQADAEKALRRSITNEVPGLRRIVNAFVNGTESEDPKQWDGRAEAEYANASGAIERTNMRFKFELHSGGVVLAEAETHEETLERWRSEAPEAVKATCSNMLSRFTITGVEVTGKFTFPDAQMWTAAAKVDYVDAEKTPISTNLPFVFSVMASHLMAVPDPRGTPGAPAAQQARGNAATPQYIIDARRKIVEQVDQEVQSRIPSGTLLGPRKWTMRAGGVVEGTLMQARGTNSIIVSRSSDQRALELPWAQLSDYDMAYVMVVIQKTAKKK